MKRYGQVFLLAIGFDLYWTLVVLFREQGLVIWIALAVLAAVVTAIIPGIRPCAGGVGRAAGRPLGADGADCVHGRVPDAAVDGGAVADVCHRLDATDPHDHLAGLVADGAGDPGRAGGLPDRRASGAITFQEPTFIVVSCMFPGWLVLMLFFHLLIGRRQ